MARHYVLGSWANADEFDYSGEQLMGSRHGKSICMDHILPNGMANLKRYGDPVEEQKKAKPKASVADKIDLAQRHFDRIEQLSIDLDTEYFAGELDEERYELLRFKMNERLAKAWDRLCKDNAIIWQKQDEKLLTEEQVKAKLQIKEKSDCFLGKMADKSLLSENGWGWQALRSCHENNVFLIGICGIMKLVKKMKGEA